MRTSAEKVARRQDTVESMLQWYKRWVSPIFGHSCRFSPPCSEYAAQAVVELGWWHGVAISTKRLLRCHPLGGSGYDPLPHGSYSEQLRS